MKFCGGGYTELLNSNRKHTKPHTSLLMSDVSIFNRDKAGRYLGVETLREVDPGKELF